MQIVGNMDSSYTIYLDSALPDDIYNLKYEKMTDYADICTLRNGEKYESFIRQNVAPENVEKIVFWQRL